MTTFDALFVPAPVREAVSDAAWLEAMLDFELALANAESLAGIVPPAAAAAIAEICRPELYDIAQLCEEGRRVGNPAEPLVRALRARAGDAAEWVHYGATSQDVLDTALMLVASRTFDFFDETLSAATQACAGLAEEHRSTPMAGRTLLQQAVPITFGLKAAGWLQGLDQAYTLATTTAESARFVQFGGAAGTLAVLGDRGVEVAQLLAVELELIAPPLPWHTERAVIRDWARALDEVAAVAAKIAVDVVLLAQTEVGEVSESEPGGSSTMPHKRNPVKAMLARACSRRVHANVSLLTDGDYEHERAAGSWQSEWGAFSEALAYAAGAADAIRACLEGLEVHAERMRENMRDELYAERERVGGTGSYLGSAETFVDRALRQYWAQR